ncbi:hypothetical protein BDZ88DRAFT_205366 [Geranomyces variabilis]|nr:hypothetical protein BDZ88DRAFT_205366 [Geranomyces variabilis]
MRTTLKALLCTVANFAGVWVPIYFFVESVVMIRRATPYPLIIASARSKFSTLCNAFSATKKNPPRYFNYFQTLGATVEPTSGVYPAYPAAGGGTVAAAPPVVKFSRSGGPTLGGGASAPALLLLLPLLPPPPPPARKCACSRSRCPTSCNARKWRTSKSVLRSGRTFRKIRRCLRSVEINKRNKQNENEDEIDLPVSKPDNQRERSLKTYPASKPAPPRLPHSARAASAHPTLHDTSDTDVSPQCLPAAQPRPSKQAKAPSSSWYWLKAGAFSRHAAHISGNCWVAAARPRLRRRFRRARRHHCRRQRQRRRACVWFSMWNGIARLRRIWNRLWILCPRLALGLSR